MGVWVGLWREGLNKNRRVHGILPVPGGVGRRVEGGEQVLWLQDSSFSGPGFLNCREWARATL